LEAAGSCWLTSRLLLHLGINSLNEFPTAARRSALIGSLATIGRQRIINIKI
jgi:hypothetical protein